MFRIILETDEGKQLEEMHEENNVNYLPREEEGFFILGELSVYSYDVFSCKDMDQLQLELERLRKILIHQDDITHINELIALSEKCKSITGSRLIFTPF
ncbi:hypothetical protein [Paenibacillus tundrae]